MANKFLVTSLIVILALSLYLIWENNTLRNYSEELRKAYQSTYEETIYDLTLLMPKGLDQHYERIRTYESRSFTEKGDSGWLLFYATQVIHDLGNHTYGHHCEDFKRNIGIECKNLTMNFAVDFLVYINRYYPNFSRIEQIYNWINYFVSYRNDTNGFGRFPVETLTYRCGDCEDQAIALAFLLETCGHETALCLIHDENLTNYGSEGLYHVFCVVKQYNFECNSTLIQLHRYKEYGTNWFVLDPAFDHLFGEDPEWMENYRTGNGTVYIPETVWDSLLIDCTELVTRAEEIGITLN